MLLLFLCLSPYLPKSIMTEPQLIAKGKVRDIYSTSDPSTLLFVATDRVSAFDIVMKNVRQLLAVKSL